MFYASNIWISKWSTWWCIDNILGYRSVIQYRLLHCEILIRVFETTYFAYGSTNRYIHSSIWFNWMTHRNTYKKRRLLERCMERCLSFTEPLLWLVGECHEVTLRSHFSGMALQIQHYSLKQNKLWGSRAPYLADTSNLMLRPGV